MEYIAAILAFVATVVGICGDTWNQRRKRPTPLGWAAGGVAAASLVLSVALAVSARKEANWQAAQRERVREIVHSDIRLALNGQLTMLEWFQQDALMTYAQRRKKRYDDYDVRRFRSDPNYMFTMLTDTTFIEATHYVTLGSVTVQDMSPDGSRMRWGSAFFYFVSRSDSIFESVLTKYAAYLEADELVAVHELRRDPFLRGLVTGYVCNNLDWHVDDSWDYPLDCAFKSQAYQLYVRRLATLMRVCPYTPEQLLKRKTDHFSDER